jgi:electron transfer flavoprotein alpha subunit
MACVLVHIEADGDHPTLASLAALGEGRRVASASGATLYAAVVVGDPPPSARAKTNPPHAVRFEGLVATLGRHGADKVVFVTAGGEARPVLWATIGGALAAACDHLRPALTLLPSSSGSHDVGARLATRLGAAYVDGPIVEHGPRGEIVLSRPVYGGGWRRRTSLDDLDRAVVVTLPAGRPPARGGDDAEAIFLEIRVPGDPRVRVLGEDDDDGAALERAAIVVAGGGGVTAATWPLVRDLAAALGGELGATRALCQRGLAPASREIGVGARHVAPSLYVVCGASGSAAHLGAVAPETEIVAIDRDPDAPVFKVAGYGIVGDLEDVLPRLIAAVRGEPT